MQIPGLRNASQRGIFMPYARRRAYHDNEKENEKENHSQHSCQREEKKKKLTEEKKKKKKSNKYTYISETTHS